MHSKKRSNSSKKSEPSSDPDPKSNPPIPPNPPPQSPHKHPNPKSSKTPSAHKNPNPSSPNPKSSKTPKPSPPMAKDPAASSHRSRKEKRLKKQDPSDEEIPAAAVSAADSGDGEKGSQSGGRVWRDDDVIAILKGLIDFRSRFGGAPTASTIGAFFNSIKESLPPSITQDQLYTKLRRLRKKYNEIVADPDASEDVPYHELLLEALGDDEKKPKTLYAEKKNIGVSTPKAKKAKAEPLGTKKPKADIKPSESNGHLENEDEEDEDDSDADVNGDDGEVEEEEEEPEVGDVCALYPLVAKEVAESLEANRMLSTKEELERILQAIDSEEANALEGGFAEQYYCMMKLMAQRSQLTTRGCTFLSEVYNHKRKHT